MSEGSDLTDGETSGTTGYHAREHSRKIPIAHQSVVDRRQVFSIHAVDQAVYLHDIGTV